MLKEIESDEPALLSIKSNLVTYLVMFYGVMQHFNAFKLVLLVASGMSM